MFREVAGVFSNQILVYLLQIAASIYVTRIIGPAQRGVYVAATLLPLLALSFVELGIPGTLIYNLSRAGDTRGELGRALVLCLLLFPVTLGLMVVFYGISLALALGQGQALQGLSSQIVLASFLLCFVQYFYTLIMNIFMGLKNFFIYKLIQLIMQMLMLAALALLWAVGQRPSPSLLVWIHVLVTTIIVFGGTGYIISRHRPVVSWQLPEHWRENYVGYGFKIYLSRLAQNLNFRLDSLILNAMLGNAALGLYSTGVATAEMLLFLPNSAAVVLLPKVASLREEDRAGTAILYLGVSFYLVLAGGVALAAVLPWVIPLAYGAAFAAAVPATWWLLPGMLALTILKTLSSAVSGMGRPETMTYSILVGLVGTIVLDFLLIPRFGIVGAASASTVAYWLSAVMILRLYAKCNRLPVIEVLRGMIREPIVWAAAHAWNVRSLAAPFTRRYCPWTRASRNSTIVPASSAPEIYREASSRQELLWCREPLCTRSEVGPSMEGRCHDDP